VIKCQKKFNPVITSYKREQWHSANANANAKKNYRWKEYFEDLLNMESPESPIPEWKDKRIDCS
jgi:hypothetical protein